MVPDVAANADPNTGYEIILRGEHQVVGGTGAVAPLYAGLFAAIGTKMGFITPELYLNNACFNDITKGDNGAFWASAGRIPCTGLGSPIGGKLADRFNSLEATVTRQLRAAQAEIAQLRAAIAGIEAKGNDHGRPQSGFPQVGALEIRLADEISVRQLATFLKITGEVYFDSLWLQRAEEAPGEFFSDDYKPLDNRRLINRLEIGTPNFIELLGDLKALGTVGEYLGSVPSDRNCRWVELW